MSAFAVETKPFDEATFAALQGAGKPVLIDVYADWCPICKQQAPIVSELMANPEFKDFTVLRVNFDTQKDVRRALKVAQQSTFIVYRGKQEVARSTGDTNKASIAATLRKALS
jgi:thiol-disulfide isomerase/thioredoxin